LALIFPSVPVELLAVIILIIGLAVPILMIRTGHSAMSPLVVIWISQTIPLGIALLNFTDEMTMPRVPTWVVLGSSFIAILAGCAVASLMTRHPPAKYASCLSRKRLLTAFVVLSALYFLSIAQGVIGGGGFPLFSSKPDQARTMFMVGQMQNIFFASGIPMFIIGIHIFHISPERWLKLLVSIVMVGLVVTYLLIGSRFMTLVWLCMALVYLDLAGRRLPLFRLAVILTIFLALFALVGYFRYGRLLAQASGSTKLYSVGVLFALQSIYSYIANSYWNLDHALHLWEIGRLHLPTWGVSMNEGLLWVLGIVPDIQNAYGFSNALNSDVMLHGGLNSTTYHWGLFKDFEMAGPVFGSFTMGWLFTFVYGRSCRAGNPAGIMIYGLLTYFVLGSFNLLPTIIPAPLFGMVLLVGALYLCSVPRLNRNH